MKYAGYGMFLGSLLALALFLYYGMFHHVDFREVVPYVFLAALMYFYLVGYYAGHKTCRAYDGLVAGFVAGLTSMTVVSIALFAAHHIFFYYETIAEPDKLAGFKSSGLLSIQRFLVYQDIRTSLFLLAGGTLFGTFAAGMGSYTAANIIRSQACRNPHMVSH